jgi:pimeloyl-ACP methyl ester carboxylesterase
VEQLYQKRWKSVPILVDVVETVNWSGANTSWSDAGQGDVLISNSPQGTAAFEVLFAVLDDRARLQECGKPPMSSRNSVSPSAARITPLKDSTAPVKAPRWMTLATTSLPLPLSPPIVRTQPFSIRDWFLSFIVNNGRAVLFPVYKGTFERRNDRLAELLGSGQSSRQYSEPLAQEIKDFRRCIDYLETRPDIDRARFAFYGMSWGGALGPIITAVEPRLKASVLLSGGFDQLTFRPESDPVNYVTRVKVPTLMLNGKYDTLVVPETAQKPMFDLLGARDKKMVVDETDHIPTTVVYIRETLAWLDRYLGPVNR